TTPRGPGQPRPGSARNKSAAIRKRRITLGAVAIVLCAALGVGGWLALSGNDADATPQDSGSSAPAVP
ncbi:serine/threonine protein kinase, partial [Streptomyces sp. NPDC002922]